MRPCDCDDLVTVKKLDEAGVQYGKHRIFLKPPNVVIEIEPVAMIVIPQTVFKRFAEWYLEDQ